MIHIINKIYLNNKTESKKLLKKEIENSTIAKKSLLKIEDKILLSVTKIFHSLNKKGKIFFVAMEAQLLMLNI